MCTLYVFCIYIYIHTHAYIYIHTHVCGVVKTTKPEPLFPLDPYDGNRAISGSCRASSGSSAGVAGPPRQPGPRFPGSGSRDGSLAPGGTRGRSLALGVIFTRERVACPFRSETTHRNSGSLLGFGVIFFFNEKSRGSGGSSLEG